MEAMLMGMRDLSLQVQDLQGAIFQAWELDMQSMYIKNGMEFKEAYMKECRRVKGSGTNIGHMKNYILMGLYQAYKADADNSPADKDTMERLVGAKVRNSDKRLSISLAKELAEMVSHCQVVKTKKKGFLNIHMRGTEGTQVMSLLEAAFTREGKRQWDPPPPKPIHRDLKVALDEALKIRRSD